MIDEQEVSDTVQRRLVDEWALDAVPFVFEDHDAIPARPYVFMQILKIGTRDDSLDGTGEILTQQFVATVVSERGGFGKEGIALTKEIKRLFPYTLRLDITDAQIVVLQPPFIESGFPDGFDWRTPVRIDYEVL